MLNEPFVVRSEAQRLCSLPKQRARAEFGDLVARAFLCYPDDPASFVEALDFNAHLASAVREESNGWLWSAA